MMTTEQPNALRLAKWLDAMPSSGYALTNQAAAELRRLHEALAEQGCDYCNHPQYAGTKCKNCGREQPAQQQEPVAVGRVRLDAGEVHIHPLVRDADKAGLFEGQPVYTSPQPSKPWVGLTPREIELLDGMIEVQLHHAAQCDRIANRTMAEKQKGWDMERVALLRKLREKNT